VEGRETVSEGELDHYGGRGDVQEEERDHGAREDENVDTSGYLEGEEIDDEVEGDGLPQDPARVELMERLCELVERISSARVGGGMEADVIDVLHDKIDEMEGLLAVAEDAADAEDTALAEIGEAEGQAETLPEEETTVENEGRLRVEFEDVGSRSGGTSRGSGRPYSMPSLPSLSMAKQDMLGLGSPAPWLASSFRFSELSLSPTHSHPELTAATNEALEATKQAAQAQADMTERVAAEAEELNAELAKIMKTLQARKEESDVSIPDSLLRQVKLLTNTAPPRPPRRASRRCRNTSSRPRKRGIRPVRARHPLSPAKLTPPKRR
jgi:hypothetical protein